MAKLIIEVDMKAIRKFAALADIDLTPEQEVKLGDSSTVIDASEWAKETDEPNMLLAFSAMIVSKQLEN